jgi:hypothetical protein
MRRDLIVTALCLVALGVSSFEARADSQNPGDRRGRTGGVAVDRIQATVNSLDRGDVRKALVFSDGNGDLHPVLRQNTVAPHWPWVVWSRFNRGRYDLAWSNWTPEGWRPAAWIERSGVDRYGNSLDADLDFDVSGRPYVAWWRNEGGTGRVYISVFLAYFWMPAYAVSDAGQDSRWPTLEVDSQTSIKVRYKTDEGTVEQMVYFDFPVTITDDINPLDFIYMGQRSILQEGD